MRQYLLIIMGISIIFSGNAFAENSQNIEIEISSPSYNYGDKLDYNIIVEEITGDDAIIFITDVIGSKSQLYSIQIFEKETRIIARDKQYRTISRGMAFYIDYDHYLGPSWI